MSLTQFIYNYDELPQLIGYLLYLLKNGLHIAILISLGFLMLSMLFKNLLFKELSLFLYTTLGILSLILSIYAINYNIQLAIMETHYILIEIPIFIIAQLNIRKTKKENK